MGLGEASLIGITILGSTGSIGVNTLDVISQHKDKYKVVALTANTGVERMIEQCTQWQPEYAVMADTDSAELLRAKLKAVAADVEVLSGDEGLRFVAETEQTDYVMAAIVGAAGLLPTLAAAKAGKRVLLANKEALVLSGQIFMDAIRDSGAELLPIDSEHNAIFQCMPVNFGDGLAPTGVQRILLTASGGPFRSKSLTELHQVTPDQACAHPNWVMGRKISVDSASMMNKGLELIEACWLFNTTPEHIQVVLHPQSIIHSLVEYSDGSVLAQLGNPDMRTPIAHGLAWPERIKSGVASLDLFDIARLDFEEPDLERFPCLRLACEAMQKGGTATAILNAANEVAVAEFLARRIRFTDIAKIVELALTNVEIEEATSLQTVLAADKRARDYSNTAIQELAA
ncbi:MAG: 1-deoxy-D-xylulose-5-phosphate reductoisomerase [Gammaproteobacteria bacterium]|jgi:1-deoxy-D-xylulose-5-phosphate reductoisomerase|nr:1-deoxy-D-xylulose-5-phosphate reductoisomerase [Gammaproteobacteria bacterium]